jgi:hypothetical protein
MGSTLLVTIGQRALPDAPDLEGEVGVVDEAYHYHTGVF